MKYIFLICATFALSIAIGIILVSAEPLNPWSPPLRLLTDWVIEIPGVKNRYDVSVSFCGDCGDLYLVTVELFLVLLVFYFCVLTHALLSAWRHRHNRSRDSGEGSISLRIFAAPVAISALMAVAIYTLLFSGLVQMALTSTSYSVYSMFGLLLIIQVSIAFHIAALSLASFVLLLRLLPTSAKREATAPPRQERRDTMEP